MRALLQTNATKKNINTPPIVTSRVLSLVDVMMIAEVEVFRSFRSVICQEQTRSRSQGHRLELSRGNSSSNAFRSRRTE